MIRDIISDRVYSILRACGYMRHILFDRPFPRSVFFYTFHKCASTLFGNYVLKNAKGLYHVDYASEIYAGRIHSEKKIRFEPFGFVYGPIRISADPGSPVGRMLVRPSIEPEFVRDKNAIFFVRDPRDILVSSYYSFGFTHGFSRVKEIRKVQEANRRKIRNMTLDEYVLASADRQAELFKTLYDLSRICERSVVLRYEDMIDRFDLFAEQLGKHLTIAPATVDEIYKRSRPREKEDLGSHRRSGEVEGFREKLKEGTIKALNIKLAEPLALFGYDK